jgi:hypothetical protein
MLRSPLPKYREPKRDTGRETQYRSQKHRKFVRSLVCTAWKEDGANCLGPRTFCHVRCGTDAGGSQTPSDWWGYPACAHHHIEDQHQHGEKEFERKYRVNLKKLALQLAAMTAQKDPEFRAAMAAAKDKKPWMFEV